MWWTISLAVLGAFCLGGVPFGYLAGQMIRGIDIRKHGSGNTGATNVLRVLGPGIGIPVLILDIFKGVVAVTAAGYWSDASWLPVVCGLAAVAGHIFTPFLGFRGGKGVATASGVFMALTPLAFLGALFLFILTVFITRYVSLGSMIAVTALFTILLIQNILGDFDQPWRLILAGLVAVLIIVRHRTNIGRLIQGRENKLKFRSSPKSGQEKS